MIDFIFSILTQCLPFIPLAFGISLSYHILRATDMTIDGSFVLGAAVFARLVTEGYPPLFAAISALVCGALAGIMTALIQRNGKIDPLLAGVLATFILSSINLIIMGKPNLSLLTTPTLVSSAFMQSENLGWLAVLAYTLLLCGIVFFVLKSRIGLWLRAFGDNPLHVNRLTAHLENLRRIGFGLTNLLAAGAGCLTAQTVGYADINMGFGMTLTGVGAIILGQQVLSRICRAAYYRVGFEFIACLVGVLAYFLSLNVLLKLDINPIYLKMLLGVVLIIFLRTALSSSLARISS